MPEPSTLVLVCFGALGPLMAATAADCGSRCGPWPGVEQVKRVAATTPLGSGQSLAAFPTGNATLQSAVSAKSPAIVASQP